MTQIGSLWRKQGKGFSLLLAMALGGLLPQAHVLSFLIRYLLMVMLFLAFLGLQLKPGSFQVSVLWVLLANILVAYLAYAVLAPFGLTYALAGFMTAIAPTAIAAPVVIGFIKRNIEYVVTAVLLTNISSALIIPVALPSLLGSQVQISIGQVLQPVLIVMFAPLLLAWLVTRLPATAQQVVHKTRVLSFSIWLLNLFIVSANASNFVRNESPASFSALGIIALISLIICILNFSLGALLGGRAHWQEASQSLGQKNLSFVIWVCLTFINPLVAMGPTFYILYHHLYNSWSIYQFEKRRSLLLVEKPQELY
jgi:BASS family bile acid:Na+ symporter